MNFPFISQALAVIPGWFLFVLWYITITGWLIAALWRKMQPPLPAARPGAGAIVHRKQLLPVAVVGDGGMTWRSLPLEPEQ